VITLPSDPIGNATVIRLAIIVSHPIQYYAPLYQHLARRDDIAIKVFFTWRAGGQAVLDAGFGRPVAWDIPLGEGYEHELVPNTARDPGTHHFWGLRNPTLVERVLAWKPDAVHITGWAWASHLAALRAFHHRRVRMLFRGDSHLLDRESALRRLAKGLLLGRIYAWPSAFLVTGSANLRYYEAFGVDKEKLFLCPHSVDVKRFAEPGDLYEREAREWRQALGFGPDKRVILFAGKFEPKKNPLGLMDAVLALDDPDVALLMVGGGELQGEVETRAAHAAGRIQVLPFQNQSKMPLVYRLGDLFVLPSLYGETWGLAVNEALASNRPVLVSNKVGCAQDVVTPDCGWVFDAGDKAALTNALADILADRERLTSAARSAGRRARNFDIPVTADAMVSCLMELVRQ